MNFGSALEQVHRRAPLVDCITNFVTVNDCANILLAVGGSPTMASDIREVQETAAAASALLCNLGAIDKVESMILGGQAANRAGKPVVFDPVGAGNTSLRRSESARLLDAVQFAVIRGNASEIRALAQRRAAGSGVDVSDADQITEKTLPRTVASARALAVQTGAVIITGETARRENARAVLEALSGYAGDFVVATAGPALESALAGRGAGAADYAQAHACTVVNLDIGGGTTEVGLISLGGMVYAGSVRVGGDKFDQAIINYIRRNFGMLIGEPTAEMIKKKIGSAFPGSEVMEIEVKGRNIAEGVPRTFTVHSNEILEALSEPLNQIVVAVIAEHGLRLTGGGALLRDLDQLLKEETGLPVHVAEEPLNCVVKGCGIALENMDKLRTAFAAG